MDLGFKIALDVIGIYCCLGPFVFLGLYILFDRFAEHDVKAPQKKNIPPKDPALWTFQDTEAHFDRKNVLEGVTSRF